MRGGQSIKVALVAILLLAVGWGVAAGIGSALGLRTEPSDVPVEKLSVAPARERVPAANITTIDTPNDPRVRLAADELFEALKATTTKSAGESALTVRVTGSGTDQSYGLSGTAAQPVITALTPAGATAALYDIADRVRTGRDALANLGKSVTPRLPFRMVDLGAVGVTPDPKEWEKGTNYSHNSGAFADVILPRAPYVDEAALAEAGSDFRAYVDHVLAEGYNAIAMPGFLEYVTFSKVGDGHEIYTDKTDHIARAKAMQRSFGPMLQYAHDMGMKVYFRTDMLALSTPLEEYFDGLGLSTDDKKLWDVYGAGLDELYESMPYVDGVLLRIGEAGKVYDLPGWDYYSDLAVTSVKSVRQMLNTLVDEAERADKEVIFRSWSVGVGAVGDMHTSSKSYEAVLGGIDSDHLIVSTKYSLGDFYSHLPLNDTLEVGDQRRIIELQSRREFEAYGSLPNDLGVLYQQALQRFTAANPRVEGIWTWTQDGGPWRAGPMSLELKTGFWQLYELNTYAAARLAQDPDADPAEITADWTRRWFSDDPATVMAIGEAMALSREAVSTGLYVGPYADHRVFALGLEPPPMMWIFEWDILTGDSAVLDVIYEVSKDNLQEAIDGGADAVATAERMRTLIAETPAATWRDPALREHFVNTADYQVNLFTMLSAYRSMVLRHAQWLDTGSDTARSEWNAARTDFIAARNAHEKAYAGDLDLPAYNLTAADIGLERADRDLPMAWAARGLLIALVGWFVVGALGRSIAARAHWAGFTRPWRTPDLKLSRTRDVALLVGVPVAALVLSRGIFTWFDSPAHLVLVLGSWLLFALALYVLLPARLRLPVCAAVGGAAILRTLLLLGVLSIRGPGRYWLMFWTEPNARTVYVTVAVALFLWVLVAAGWAIAATTTRRRATGVMLLAAGVPLLGMGAMVAAIGLEDAMTMWNDQMALLPWGLSRILGITVYLGIPSASVYVAVILGAVLCAGGAVLSRGVRRARLR